MRFAGIPTPTICVAGLAVGSPISGRKCDVPKARCGLLELDCNLWPAGRLPLRGHYTACHLIPSERVLHYKRLFRHHVGCHGNQRAMSAYSQGVRPFRKGWALCCRPVNYNGNAQHQPLAASLHRPRSWRSGFCSTICSSSLLFLQAFQCTVPQFAEFSIQEMLATQKRQ